MDIGSGRGGPNPPLPLIASLHRAAKTADTDRREHLIRGS
jgi:hypothetical protein